MRQALRVGPRGVHGAAVLAHGNRHAERGTELQAHGLHGVEEIGVLARLAARRHPIRGKAHVVDVATVRRREVRERFGNCEAARGRRVDERHGRTLARRHGLAVERLVAHHRHRAVGGGQLVGAHHLVARHEARHGTVRDRDEERLVGDRRQVEQTEERVLRLHAGELQRFVRARDVRDVAHHARRLAEQDLDVHVDRAVVEVFVLEDETPVARRLADERHGAALAGAQLLEPRARVTLQRKHVALLGLAAPDLHRVHGGLFVVDRAERELSARRLHEFRAAIGKSACTDIVDGKDGVLPPHRRAGVDHALTASLHFRVTALNTVEVERLVVRAGHHRARRAAAEADAHCGPADLHDVRAGLDRLLLHLVADDHAVSARKHDGLVVAPVDARRHALVRAEEARELRTAELVAERGAADWAFRHDRERRGETLWKFRVLALPRLRVTGDVQVAHHEAADARVRARAAARGRLVADFATHARRRARVGRNRRRVIVGFDLHQLIELELAEAVGGTTGNSGFSGIRAEYLGCEAFHDRRVVLVGDERALPVLLVGVLDHPEEGILLLLPVDDELRAKDLVAAVFGIHLTEHHEFRVRGIAPRRLEALGEVLHLRLADRETERNVRLANRLHAASEHVERDAGLRRRTVEEVVEVRVHALGHAVVQRANALADWESRHLGGLCGNAIADAAFDARDALETAVAEDVGGLRRPRRNRALARRHVEKVVSCSWFVVRGLWLVVRIVCARYGIQEQGRACERLGIGAFSLRFDRVHPAGVNRDIRERRVGGGDGGAQGVEAERRIRRGSHHQNWFHFSCFP